MLALCSGPDFDESLGIPNLHAWQGTSEGCQEAPAAASGGLSLQRHFLGTFTKDVIRAAAASVRYNYPLSAVCLHCSRVLMQSCRSHYDEPV
jgi:hypothetical protein